MYAVVHCLVKDFQGDLGLHLPHLRVAGTSLDAGVAGRFGDVPPQWDAKRELVVGPHRSDGRVPVRTIVGHCKSAAILWP